MSVSKKVITFPFVNPIDGLVHGISVPGTNPVGAIGAFAGNPLASSVNDTAGTQALNVSAQRVQLSQGAGKLRAVTLAGDSAYSCCDIWTHLDQEAVRVDSAHPATGLNGADIGNDIWVTVPNLVPGITVNNTQTMFDGIQVANGAGGTFLAAPLRLNLWYDEVPTWSAPVRPPLYARCRAKVNAGQSTIIHVPIEGRRLIVIRQSNGVGTGQFAVDGLYGRMDDTAPNIEPNNVKPFSSGNVEAATQDAVSASLTLNNQLLCGVSLLRITHTNSVNDIQGVTFEVFGWDN